MSSHSDLSCLFSWAARSSSWIFLVICSVLRITSSVLGSVGSESISKSSSSGIELPSPSQPLLLSLPLRQNLLRGRKNKHKSSFFLLLLTMKLCLKSALPDWSWVMFLPRVIHLGVIECVVIVAFWHAALLLKLWGLEGKKKKWGGCQALLRKQQELWWKRIFKTGFEINHQKNKNKIKNEKSSVCCTNRKQHSHVKVEHKQVKVTESNKPRKL